MRVLYLLRYYPTLTETFVAEEIGAVAERGIAVSVAALGSRADGALQDRSPTVPVHPVPRRSVAWRLQKKSAGQRWLEQHQRPKDAARLEGLRKIASAHDHIHVHFAGEAAEMAHALHLDTGIPYTVTVHAADLFKPRPALEAVLRSAAQVLTISSHNQTVLQQMSIASRVVRCGPNIARLTPKPWPSGPMNAAFIGRNVPKKGLDTLLEAWSRLHTPGATLSLVTDASLTTPPGVHVMGLQPPSAIPDLLAKAHVCVLPCRRADDGDMDGIPLVLMEAMALGRPVLTTPISGITELVDDEVGWLVPPEDPTALAAELEQIAGDLTAAGQKGRAGPHRLRERGYHLGAQVDGVIDSWGFGEASATGMAADSREVQRPG